MSRLNHEVKTKDVTKNHKGRNELFMRIKDLNYSFKKIERLFRNSSLEGKMATARRVYF